MGMRIVERDRKNETTNQSILPSEYTINTPDKHHAHGQDMSDQEPNSPPMVLQHPVYARHREEETTGLNRKGGPNGRDENPMTTTHVLDQYPSEDRTPADIIEKYYAQAIHDLIHLCNPIQGVAKTWTAQAKNDKHLGQNPPTHGGSRTQDPQLKKQRRTWKPQS